MHRLGLGGPRRMRIRPRETARIAGGLLLGVGVLALAGRVGIGAAHGLPLIVAPLGASAVLLFAAPASPLAHPWQVLAGNTLSALVGMGCSQAIGDRTLAAMAAVAAAVVVMVITGSLHPPGGAIALFIAVGGPAVAAAGYRFALTPIAVDSLLLLAVAFGWNNLTGATYPAAPPVRQPPVESPPRVP